MQTNSGNIKTGRTQQCSRLGSQRGLHPQQQLAWPRILGLGPIRHLDTFHLQ